MAKLTLQISGRFCQFLGGTLERIAAKFRRKRCRCGAVTRSTWLHTEHRDGVWQPVYRVTCDSCGLDEIDG